jgi:hypothetical protein
MRPQRGAGSLAGKVSIGIKRFKIPQMSHNVPASMWGLGLRDGLLRPCMLAIVTSCFIFNSIQFAFHPLSVCLLQEYFVKSFSSSYQIHQIQHSQS